MSDILTSFTMYSSLFSFTLVTVVTSQNRTLTHNCKYITLVNTIIQSSSTYTKVPVLFKSTGFIKYISQQCCRSGESRIIKVIILEWVSDRPIRGSRVMV